MSDARFYVCAACGDTGQNSRGGKCFPCTTTKRLHARRYAVGRRVGELFSITAGPSYDVNALRDYRPKTDTEYMVILGAGPGKEKKIARWKNGAWQRKPKKL